MDDPLRSAATRIGPDESVRRIVANVGVRQLRELAVAELLDDHREE